MKRPFLPYRDKNETLLFPTGEFVGVYYSEELKYAAKLGYKIVPLKGYLYKEKIYPFVGFVGDLFERRMQAKKRGEDGLAYVYKILMNSLYGRFGINPKTTVTEVCEKSRYDILLQSQNFLYGNKLSDRYYIVNYLSDTSSESYGGWNRISAVYISAAITACARIYMFSCINRDDCYYTDTDSTVLAAPLRSCFAYRRTALLTL